MPLHKPIDQITEEDLKELKEQAEPEKKTLDYKRDRIGKLGDDRKEFLFDVSSFANSSGGHLLLGIEEEDGVPVSIPGLAGINSSDDEISALENVCRNGIEPRIPGLHMRAIPVSGQGPVIVVRIPRSWARPHMVKYRGTNKFYARNSNGKYPLDVQEIRSAFLLSETATERIRQFRIDRIATINSDETPVRLQEVPKIVLHLVPWSFSDTQAQIDVSQVDFRQLLPIAGMGFNGIRFNFDGVVGWLGDPPCAGCTQLFRSGPIETVDAYTLEPVSAGNLIPSFNFERDLLRSIRELTSFLQQIGVEAPIFVMLTLLDVRGYRMGVGEKFYTGQPNLIDRDHLFVQETLIESFDSNLHATLKALVDPVWNACGHAATPNYREEDESFRWTT